MTIPYRKLAQLLNTAGVKHTKKPSNHYDRTRAIIHKDDYETARQALQDADPEFHRVRGTDNLSVQGRYIRGEGRPQYILDDWEKLFERRR